MKFLAILLLTVAVSVATKARLPSRAARVDGLLRAETPISLADVAGVTASSVLTTNCNGNTLSLTLTVTDGDGDLEKSSLVVGSDPDTAACSTEDEVEGVLSLNVNSDQCGGTPTPLSGAPSITYTWEVTVNNFVKPVGSVVFQPYSTKHVVSCSVGIVASVINDIDGPGAVSGGDVTNQVQTVNIKLEKDATTMGRAWKFTVTPEGELPTGLSYKLTGCTAKPAETGTPILTLITPEGCITPRTGTSGGYNVGSKRYDLTVRAFSFAGSSEKVAFQCTAALCTPDAGTGLCTGQSAELTDCTPPPVVTSEEGDTRKVALDARSQVPNKFIRRVRSATQHIESNVVVM